MPTLWQPDFEKAINNLAVVYLRTGETQEALDLLERGLDLHPASVPLLSNQARALQELGQLDRATEIFDQIEEVNQSNPYFYIYRGELALSQGDTQTALTYMRRALRTDSEVPGGSPGVGQGLSGRRRHAARPPPSASGLCGSTRPTRRRASTPPCCRALVRGPKAIHEASPDEQSGSWSGLCSATLC